MQKTPIEWTDFSWNPIKGICPVGCWYCYALKIYKRFSLPKFITLYPKELEAPYKRIKSFKIFVCSTIELFHPAISEKWRNMIFRVIEDLPQHTFQVLTKLPQNIDRSMPPNVWLGTSITTFYDYSRKGHLLKKGGHGAGKIFISFEPLLGDMPFEDMFFKDIDWIIVGKLTQHGKKYDPHNKWLVRLIHRARYFDVPIFMKNNLKEIWGESLIQEMPE